MSTTPQDHSDDFYVRLRIRIRQWLEGDEGRSSKWAEYILLAPDLLHVMSKLSMDKEVAVADKAKLAGAIAYFLSPWDLIPEAIAGPAGYVDDVALAAYVLNGIMNHNRDAVVRHWAGDGDVLVLVQEILRVADEMVGSGLWRRLKGMF